jgi:hypothetical protein
VVSFTTWVLYPQGKRPQYPLDRRLGGPHNRSRRHGEEKIVAPTRTQIPAPWSSSPEPVTISTLLSWLPKLDRLMENFKSDNLHSKPRCHVVCLILAPAVLITPRQTTVEKTVSNSTSSVACGLLPWEPVCLRLLPRTECCFRAAH